MIHVYFIPALAIYVATVLLMILHPRRWVLCGMMGAVYGALTTGLMLWAAF